MRDNDDRLTTRRLVALGATAALVLIVAVAVAFGTWEVALVALAVIQAGALAIALDARGRTGLIAEVVTKQIDDADRPVRQVEALMQLFARVKPRAAMPSSGGWALDATNILTLLDLIESGRPGLVVELGSGTSSIWLGYALEQVGSGGRLVSFESNSGFAAITQAEVRKHALDSTVEICNAPLVEAGLEHHEARWYDTQAFDGIDGIDLLIVDGPPETAGPMSRYPALPKLISRISDRAIVALDDTNRPDEQAIVRRWLEETPGLRKVESAGNNTLTIMDRTAARPDSSTKPG